ncbi:MAG: hypothetical protein ACYSTN_08990 [Planctomycetota bacterium]|jgi:hypothetical protein
MVIERQNETGVVTDGQARQVVSEFFAKNDYSGKRIIVLVPDILIV